MDDALKRLARFVGHVPDWRELTSFLPEEVRGELFRRSALAATFAATLELARDGPHRAAPGSGIRADLSAQPRVGRRRDAGVSERAQQLRLVEALLFAAAEPLDEAALAQPSRRRGAMSAELLRELAESYAGRGVNLVRLAGGWAFRTAPDLARQIAHRAPGRPESCRAPRSRPSR